MTVGVEDVTAAAEAPDNELDAAADGMTTAGAVLDVALAAAATKIA